MVIEEKKKRMLSEAEINCGHRKEIDLEYFIPGLIFSVNFVLAVNS